MSAAAAPTKEALKSLYTSTLRTSRAFASYNYRHYFILRTQSAFRSIQNESSPTVLQKFYEDKLQELEVLKRAAAVNQMYGGRKLVVETKEELPPQDIYQRGDN